MRNNLHDVKLKQFALFSILTLVLALFGQCGSHPDSDGYGNVYPMDPESYAVIDSCMAYMYSDPARTHQMLDSVRDAGVMSAQRCDMMHAMVLFSGESRWDSALVICNRLLDAGKFGDDHYLEAEICELATNITIGCNRYIEVLKYADRGIPLCHGREEMRSDEAAMLGRAGTAHQVLGNIEEARLTYNRALDLLKDDTSFSGFISLISLQKKQAGLHREAGNYDSLICVCNEILAEVERFDRDPSFIDPRPQTMITSGEATHDFADFYQTQIYGRLAGAYRMKVEQGVSDHPKADRDSASAYVDKWLQTSASHSAQNMAAALRELFFTGHRAEFDAAKSVVSEAFMADSLSHDYCDFLILMADDAESRHDLASSISYLMRAAVVNDSLYKHQLMHALSEQMSLHMVQEARLAQQDAEYQLAKNRMLMMLLVVFCVAVLIVSIMLLKKNQRQRVLSALQKDLMEQKDKLSMLHRQLEERKAELVPDTPKSLFERIVYVVNEKKLYLNPDLDIKMLSEEVKSCRTNISGCIKATSGKPFRLWLSEYRLNLFVQMLKQNPEAPIDELMAQCGYREQSTFRRQFKAVYGMTASEYRRSLLAGKTAETEDKIVSTDTNIESI